MSTMTMHTVVPQFVTTMPRELQPGILYISEIYFTSCHLCCCGCGKKVVNTLDEMGWKLTKQDGMVSLWPSVGNSNLPCLSHYVIRDNRVVWFPPLSGTEIRAAFRRDEIKLARQLEKQQTEQKPTPWWETVWRWIFR